MNAISRVEGQRGIEEERVKPDTAEGDGPEAVISFIGEVCARAATFGEDGVGEDRWRRSAVMAVTQSGGGAAGGFPSLAAPL